MILSTVPTVSTGPNTPATLVAAPQFYIGQPISVDSSDTSLASLPAGTTLTSVVVNQATPASLVLGLSNPITIRSSGSTAVALDFSLNADESQQLTALSNQYTILTLQTIASLKQQNVLVNFLQGGAGNDQLYGNPNAPTWMVGGSAATARIRFTTTTARTRSRAAAGTTTRSCSRAMARSACAGRQPKLESRLRSLTVTPPSNGISGTPHRRRGL